MTHETMIREIHLLGEKYFKARLLGNSQSTSVQGAKFQLASGCMGDGKSASSQGTKKMATMML